jgi:hypothetical protein
MQNTLISVSNVYFKTVLLQIKLMVLNPEHGFTSDRPLARDDVKLLIDVCVQKLSEKYSPSLETIQMQAYFDTNFTSRHGIINENRANIKLRTAPFIKEIIETCAKSKDDLEKLYRKIVVTTVISSGIGNPTHLNILREATGKFSTKSFMESVLLRTAINFHSVNFVILFLPLKKEQMLKISI